MNSFPSEVSKRKKRAHARSFLRCGTTLSFLSLIQTRSFGSLGSCKKTQKTRCRVLSPLSNVFLDDLNDPNDLV